MFKFCKTINISKAPRNKKRISLHLKILDFDKGRNTYLAPADLFILDEHLNEFILGNGGDEIEKISKNNKTQFSSTIRENQINFIRALLYMDYGIETPQEVKTPLIQGN